MCYLLPMRKVLPNAEAVARRDYDTVVKYLEQKIQTGGPVNVAAIANEMAHCIVDMIMEQQEQNQAALLLRPLSPWATNTFNGAGSFRPSGATTR
jgi:hypothetical protein